MDSTRPRRAAALLLTGALLLAAVPSGAATPPARGAGEATDPLSLFGAFAAWLTAFWPGAAPDASSGAETTAVASGDPTADPERGGNLDPDG